MHLDAWAHACPAYRTRVPTHACRPTRADPQNRDDLDWMRLELARYSRCLDAGNAICSMEAQNFNAEPKGNQMHFVQEIKRILVYKKTGTIQPNEIKEVSEASKAPESRIDTTVPQLESLCCIPRCFLGQLLNA